jgi:hypothetical protein
MYTWSAQAPVGKDYYLHQLSIYSSLANLDGDIFGRSGGVVCGHTLTCGTKVAPIVAALPQLQADYSSVDPAYLGKLGRWEVFRSVAVDPYIMRMTSPDEQYSAVLQITDYSSPEE